MLLNVVRGDRYAFGGEFYEESISMASSGHTSYLSRKRIIDNVEECESDRTPEASPEEETTVASRDKDAQRIKKPWSREATQAVVLGAILFGGLAAFIGLLIVQ